MKGNDAVQLPSFHTDFKRGTTFFVYTIECMNTLLLIYNDLQVHIRFLSFSCTEHWMLSEDLEFCTQVEWLL